MKSTFAILVRRVTKGGRYTGWMGQYLLLSGYVFWFMQEYNWRPGYRPSAASNQDEAIYFKPIGTTFYVQTIPVCYNIVSRARNSLTSRTFLDPDSRKEGLQRKLICFKGVKVLKAVKKLKSKKLHCPEWNTFLQHGINIHTHLSSTTTRLSE